MPNENTTLPTPMASKSEGMRDFLRKMFPTQLKNIDEGKCASCGKLIVATEFRDDISVKEYGISGMCQECQDGVFKDSGE